jgi:hypothetical protein
MAFTGRPTAEDLEAIQSENAAHIISTVKSLKVRSFREWFPTAGEEARSLLLGLLQFSPAKRMTATQAMRHPYLQQFYNAKD